VSTVHAALYCVQECYSLAAEMLYPVGLGKQAEEPILHTLGEKAIAEL